MPPVPSIPFVLASSPQARPRVVVAPSLLAWGLATLLLSGPAAQPAWAQEPQAPASETASGNLPRVEVRARSNTGALRSPSATGLDLSWKDTPQSLHVLGEQAMQDYRLYSVGDALGSLPGIYVERFETDRSSYFARGFEINNFQIDGLGLLPGRFTGLEDKGDTAMYERIEVLRGAGSLLIGAGNPSATVNYVRKRPGSRFQAQSSLSLGSWRERRLDVDLSSPLNRGGTVRARLVLMGQGQDSYLDRYQQDKTLAYGVFEVDLGEDTLLTVGASKQQRKTRGGMWGAVPLVDKNGTPLDFDRHVSSAAAWTRWDVSQDEWFADLSHSLGGGWQARATAMRMTHSGRSQLLWWSDSPDPQAGNGGLAWPSRYDPDRKESSVDLRLSGPFEALGWRNELVLCALAGSRERLELSTGDNSLGTPLPPLGAVAGAVRLARLQRHAQRLGLERPPAKPLRRRAPAAQRAFATDAGRQPQPAQDRRQELRQCARCRRRPHGALSGRGLGPDAGALGLRQPHGLVQAAGRARRAAAAVAAGPGPQR